VEDFFSKKKVDKQIPIPLYYQLKELLLDYIQNADINSTLPTEKWLSSYFSLSRSTVRQALGELVDEGYIVRQKGKGTTVISRKIEQDFLIVLESFNDEMQEKGMKPNTKVISAGIIEPSAAVQKALSLNTGEQVVQLLRLRSINSEPVVLVTTYLPADYQNLRNIVLEDLEHESMYKLMETAYGVNITFCKRMLEVRIAGDFEAQHLKIHAGAPLQYIETVSSNEMGKPIEYSRAFYRGDNNKFVIETARKLV
jgi:GntR family transcriptional regulator